MLLVAHLFWEQEVVGSNPTVKKNFLKFMSKFISKCTFYVLYTLESWFDFLTNQLWSYLDDGKFYKFDIFYSFMMNNYSYQYDIYGMKINLYLLGIKIFVLAVVIKYLIIILFNIFVDKTINVYNFINKSLGLIFFETLIVSFQEVVKQQFGGHYPFKNNLYNMFPLFVTVFFVILLSNFLGLIPFVIL